MIGAFFLTSCKAQFEVAQWHRVAEKTAPVRSEPWFEKGFCQAGLAKTGWANGAGEEHSLVVAATTPAHRLLSCLFLPVHREQPLSTWSTGWEGQQRVERDDASRKNSLAAAATDIARGCDRCAKEKPAPRSATVAQFCGTNNLESEGNVF